MTASCAGVVLAAGAGRRFGRPKALVAFAGRPLIERAVATLEAGGCSPVIAVVGAQADRVGRECDLGRAVVVRNEGWAAGMSTSLASGLAEAGRQGAAGALVAPVDQPAILPGLVERLVARWQSGSLAVVAGFGGLPRTPVLFDRSLWERVVGAASGDTGGRAFLRAHPELVDLVECSDVGDAADIDRQEDLEAIEEQWQRLVSLPPPDGR